MSTASNVVSSDSIQIAEGLSILSIPLSELSFRFSRSGGPGGQHVNRTTTRPPTSTVSTLAPVST